MLRGHRDLKVYQLAYKLAMEVFTQSKSFPQDERYSLTSQRSGEMPERPERLFWLHGKEMAGPIADQIDRAIKILCLAAWRMQGQLHDWLSYPCAMTSGRWRHTGAVCQPIWSVAP